MTREEKLKFCSVCKYQCLDIKRGIVCGLTNEYADFDTKCKNMEIDAEIASTKSQISYFELHEVPWYKSIISSIVDSFLITTLGILLLVLPLERFFLSINVVFLSILLWVEFYLFFFESLWCRTPGMMVMGLRISMLDGSRPSLNRIMLRTICFPLNIILIITGFKWRAHNGQIIWLHDKISRTYIVDPSNSLY